jgi:hypothetical protein
MRRIAIVGILVSFVGSGCALGITAPRRGAPVSERPVCDTGRGGVVADGLFGTGIAVGGAGLLAENEAGAGLAMVAVGGLLIASAVRGNNAANACEKAVTAYAGYVTQLERERRIAKQQRGGRARAPTVTVPAAFEPMERTPQALPTPKQAAEARVQPVPPTPAPAPAAERDEPDTRGEGDWSAFWEEVP